MERRLVAVRAGRALAALAIVLVAVGCSSDGGSGSKAAVATAVAGAPTVVGPADGQALMQQMGAALTIIDVRTPEEFAAGHVEGAINIDLEGGGFSAEIAGLDKSKAYIVYCHSGRRSAIAASTMVAAGFTQIFDLGGIQAWQDAGLPVVTT